jgi:5-formyltetrahydrofolate cyclo-ligase
MDREAHKTHKEHKTHEERKTHKAAARKTALARRKVAFSEQKSAAAQACGHFLGAIDVGALSTIAAYRPIKTELDPTPLMMELIARGLTVCVPKIIGAGLPLQFLAWHPDAPMKEGAFGAAIPGTEIIVTPDLVIAPLVAFDRNGGRLGYGGGFYDRTLLQLREKSITRAFGYAFSAQEAADLPLEPTDERLDGFVTEDGVIFTR